MYFWFEVSVLTLFLLFVTSPLSNHVPINGNAQSPPSEFEQLNYNSLINQPKQIKRLLNTPLNESTRSWLSYRLALLYKEQGKPQESCTLFAHLSLNEKFELKELANLRAHEVCSLFSNEAGLLHAIDTENITPWFKKLAIDVALKNATKRNDSFDLMKLHYEVSKRPLARSKKIEHTKKALNFAESLNNKEFSTSMLHRLQRLEKRDKKKNFLERSLALINDRQFKKAKSDLKLIAHSKNRNFYTRYRAYKGLRKIEKLQLNSDAYIKATEDLARFVFKTYKKYKRPGKSLTKRLYDTQILLARTYWTKNKTKKAISTLRLTASTLKKKHSLSKIYYLRGRIEEEKQNLKNAIWWYEKSLQEPKHSQSIFENTLWLIAWNSRKINLTEKSIRTFKILVNETQNQFDKNRYKYWLAKTYLQIKQKTEANLIFEDLIKDDVMGYYGLLAAREQGYNLTQNFISRKVASFQNQEVKSKHINEQKIKWLIAVQENEIAGQYLNHIARKLRHNGEGDMTTWSSLFNYYLKSKQYLKMFADLGQLNRELRQNIIAQNPEVFFPKPYYGSVKKSSDRFGLSPSMVYAIIRQESAFNPKARSFAHAMGLMQLLPQVAKYTSDKYDVPMSSNDDLYNPKVNIQLGSAFLKELFSRYDGQFILAVASYNASEKAINNWMKTRYTGNAIEFIEDIPYEETRTYVRLVMRNFVYYEVQQSAPAPISFPEWALKLRVAANSK